MAGNAGWIDVHAHLITPAFAQEWQAAPPACRDGMPGLPPWSLEATLHEMDRLGVQAAAVSVPSPGVAFGDPGQAPTLAHRINDECAETVGKASGRLGLLACLPLPDPAAALAEIDRCAAEPEVHGFVLFTNYEGRYLGDPAFRPVLAALADRQATVLLHPTSPPHADALCGGRPGALLEFSFETTRTITDLLLTGTLAECPGLRLIVPHAGAALGVLADRVDVLSRVMSRNGADPVDVVGGLRSLYYDLAGPVLPRQLAALLRIADPERLLYGTDLPFFPADRVRAWHHELAGTTLLDDRQRQRMAWETAATLFPRLAKVPQR